MTQLVLILDVAIQAMNDSSLLIETFNVETLDYASDSSCSILNVVIITIINRMMIVMMMAMMLTTQDADDDDKHSEHCVCS